MLHLNVLFDWFRLPIVSCQYPVCQLLLKVMEVLELIDILKLIVKVWEHWQLVALKGYFHVAEALSLSLHELGLGTLEELVDLKSSLGQDAGEVLHY